MQKKLYIGGLPWEIDRIGLLNYFKAILECNEINASYEPPFVTNAVPNPNSSIKVVDVFVATDRETGKSRGFGFITLEFADDAAADDLFAKIIDLMNKRVMIGIRGPRDLIVNEADPKPEGDNGNHREAPAAEATTEGNGEAEGGAFGLDW